MSAETIKRRLDALAARTKAETPRRVIRLIVKEDGDTRDEAIARWCVENPDEAPPDEGDFIILRTIVSPEAGK